MGDSGPIELSQPEYEKGKKRYQQNAGQHQAHAPHQKFGECPDDTSRKDVPNRASASKECNAGTEQHDAHGEKEIVETAHEAEALVVGAVGGKPPAAGELAQRFDLRGRDDAGYDRRFEVVVVKHHSFSTVTLRLV
ncbi:MAG: hypothetical protein WB760_24395 [Xanthobacteraceae bacterium]